ncbi:TatD family hydrolase [Sphaerochaeta sp. PS]|uniref:TatD family hydrolase n=1 Tax=Sphaerochaeta sp. PS TaxID=3076336 RepID=UPI0028A537CC|nr:TatD family hydrolase [Sphaerochaeta sp. PS]MDT4760968.1 TatD family hydrolase [Sphaerochaeta sp. PS]
MQFFDTHAHIGLLQDDKMEQLLAVQLARVKMVKHIVSICNSLSDFERTYANLESASNVFHAVGVSPTEVANPGKDWEERILSHATKNRVIAIGETGLDYYHMFGGDKSLQIELFLKHLELAKQLDLPVIIHNRNSGDDLLNILAEKLPPKGGILHCFGEDWEFAKKALELNLTFSFAGNLTFKNSRSIQEVAHNLPIERIVIESEAPFMTPYPYKGERNKISYIVETAKALSQIRETYLEELSESLYANSLRAFSLPKDV